MKKILFALIVSTLPVFAEKIAWPLEVNSPISGTFAEFRRPGTLHMGIDIKTYGMNGFKIVSPFSGYVNFLRYSSHSYGLSVDIYSPESGFLARYAHLMDLKGELKELERLKEAAILLTNNSKFDIKLPANMFPTTKSMVLGSTGESGSGISHLHFELMNKNGYINPLVYGNYIKEDYHPPVIRKLFIEDSSGQQVFKVEQDSADKYTLNEIPAASGKIRFKVEGYDTISSRNKNNLFSLVLVCENDTLFSRKFDEISYKDYSKQRFLIFDTNRSSLSPPVYVYNLFDADSSSLESEKFSDKKTVKIRILLSDYANNTSSLEFSLNLSADKKKHSAPGKRFFTSADKRLSLDFSKTDIYGDPEVSINKLNELPQNARVEGLPAVSDIYEIKTSGFSWVKPATGHFSFVPAKGDAVYIYNTETNMWNAAMSRGSGNIIFDFHRPGIVAVLRDKIPPVIEFPFLMTRNINVNPDKDMIQRMYSVYDRGQGISGSFEVYLESQKYPYYYDYDRKSVIVEIPESIGRERDFVSLKIRTKDKAGNQSDWFTDIIYFRN